MDIEPLDEDVWPRDVRRRLNLLGKLLSRPWDVLLAKDGSIHGRLLQTDEKAILILPRNGRSGSTVDHPFKGVYTNEVSPSNPSGVPGIRVIYGTVNGTMPEDFSLGDIPPFFVPQSSLPSSGVFWVHVNVTVSETSPGVTWGDITVEYGTEVPEPEDEESEPDDFYLELFSFAEDPEGTGPNPEIFIAQAVTTSLGLAHSGCKNWFTQPQTFSHAFLWGQL